MRRRYNTKRCPRCNTKNLKTNYRCEECGLIFGRVENGSNKLAKQYILTHQKDMVIKAPMFPKDVSKKKFLLLSGFLGFFGAHNFYVGRFFKAIFQLVCGVIVALLAELGGLIASLDVVVSFLSIPAGINAFFWLNDFIMGIFNKYKIPVAVDFIKGENI